MLKNVGIKLFSGISRYLELNSSALYHTTPLLLHTKPDEWVKHNEKIYPPLKPEDPPRGAFVVHMKKDIHANPKKFWFIAQFVRGMSIDEALKQLLFVRRKASEHIRQTLLEAQEMAVKEHNVEFKSNLWVSESFVEKSFVVKGIRRHAKGRFGNIDYKFVNYFCVLEEGKPPKHYITQRRPRTGEEMLEKYINDLRSRRISYT